MAARTNYVEIFNNSTEILTIELLSVQIPQPSVLDSTKVNLNTSIPLPPPLPSLPVGINVEHSKNISPVQSTNNQKPIEIILNPNESKKLSYTGLPTVTIKSGGSQVCSNYGIETGRLFYWGNNRMTTYENSNALKIGDYLRLTHLKTGNMLRRIKKLKGAPHANMGPMTDTFQFIPVNKDTIMGTPLCCNSVVLVMCNGEFPQKFLRTFSRNGEGKAFYGDRNDEEDASYFWIVGKATEYSNINVQEIFNSEIITLSNAKAPDRYLRSHKSPTKMSLKSAKPNVQGNEYWIITKCDAPKVIMGANFNVITPVDPDIMNDSEEDSD
jgi:hypothetical protein